MTLSAFQKALNRAEFLGEAFPRIDAYAALYRFNGTTNVEVSGDGYSRVLIPWTSAVRDQTFGYDSLGTACYNSGFSFGVQSTAWGTASNPITQLHVFDGAAGTDDFGNLSLDTGLITTGGKILNVAGGSIAWYNRHAYRRQLHRVQLLEYTIKFSETVPTAATEIGIIITPINTTQLNLIDAGTYVEWSGSGYSRKAISEIDWFHPDDGFGGELSILMNENDETWFTASANVFGTLAYFDGADLVGYSYSAVTFAHSINVPSGDTVKIRGQLPAFTTGMLLQYT
jgi:hypothetical protein